MLLTFVILIIVIVILVMILNDNKKDFKTITFKDKKLYLIVQFLHGNCGLKTNKAVLSRNGDDFFGTSRGINDTLKVYQLWAKRSLESEPFLSLGSAQK